KIAVEYNLCIGAAITKYQGSHPVASGNVEIGRNKPFEALLNLDGSERIIRSNMAQVGKNSNAVDLQLTFIAAKGELKEANVSVNLFFNNWSQENYVLMPAAAYNGNRFDSRSMSYPPQLASDVDMGPDTGTIISDVPRLNIHKGQSGIQQLTRDLSTPAIGFYSPDDKKGFWLLTRQDTHLGDTGIAIEESIDRSKAIISVSAPGVRHYHRYTMCSTKQASEDTGADFKEGDKIELNARLYFFDCPDIQALFDYFTDIRKDLTGEVKLFHQLPFSSAWKIQEEKYNRQNWEEEHGYYSIGMRDGIYQDWQIGWVGGLMSTYPLLFEGSELSRERALKTFDFAFGGGQDVSGFFHGCGHNGKWYGDNFGDCEKKWHLIRKSSDALYYIIKQFMLLKKQDENFQIPGKWIEGTKKCADAFIKLWDKYGQFGQFVNTGTGEMIIGGSVSAGIAPAALALAWQYFGAEEYLRVAKEAACCYYKNYTSKGITTGGPGEALQCPDSESAFGLLEAFVVLYEATGEKKWLDMARDMGNQCFTWCVSYDFKFPPESTFGKLDMHTAGSVYANVQNKHSAPGICTLSGNSLFKLYRYTGNKKYLELIREIAHNMTQYLSREDRPVRAMEGQVMPRGWMNERVEMSDWWEPVGEIFYGSCWCEVSNMLANVEVPGLYVQPDTGFACAIDHIDVKIMENNCRELKLKVKNPTEFTAKVKILSENSCDMPGILGQNALWGCQVVELKPGDEKEIIFDKIR
ncbi:MAG: hypothetical protein FIA99_07570, partial [Ruminiclostridium sp.]|nr:hypothetical protein [Ruminiclostridium sp.]